MQNHMSCAHSLDATEDLFRASVDCMPDSFGIYSAIRNSLGAIQDFLIEYVNNEACRCANMTKEELTGKRLSEKFPIMWDNGLFLEFCKVIETSIPLANYTADCHDLFKDKHLYKICEFRAVKAKDSIAVTWSDITEKIEIERKLRESELHFSRAFENASIGMSITGIDGKWLKVNRSLCDMTGYSESELLNLSFEEVTHPEDTTGNLSLFKDSLEGKLSAYQIEKRFIHKNGQVVWVQLNTSLIRSSDGSPLYFTSQFQDITKIKQANETIEYDRLKTEFFTNISHELRTPINIILNSIQLIEFRVKNGQLTNTLIHKYNDTMRQNCFRLIRLVNNLIDATKIDAGFYTIHLQNQDIVQLIKQITLSVSDYVKSKNIELVFDSTMMAKTLACDPDKIERIMLNLLSNAIKFSKANGKINVQIIDQQSSILILVKDNGIGIKHENLHRIFERFSQIDKSIDRCHQGSGIGLSLVKSFVEMHEGSIDVSSIYGGGSEFKILLPVRVLEDSNIAQEQHSIYFSSNNIEKIHIEFSDIYFEQ